MENARVELDLLLAESADKAIRRSNHTFYTKANKPDTLLAMRLRRPDKNQIPIRLKIDKHTLTSNPVKILCEFRNRLEGLYKAKPSFTQQAADRLFRDLSLPTMTDSDRESLETPIRPEEILAAIQTLKPHKRPGPDGLSATYYKKFAPILTPLLCKSFNALLQNQAFGRDTLTAIIAMIPKPNTDNSLWSNFRPISLLNLDIKLLAKVLALRLNPLIGRLINKDQIFIEGVRGEDYRSDVAVDDISLMPGYCKVPTPPPPTTTTTTTRISSTTSTTTTTRRPVTPGSPPPGSCEISGDPHYYTFDNEVHHFMGTCTYTLSKLCEVDGHLAEFNVEAVNEHRGSSTRVSYINYVNIDMNGYRITLEKNRNVKVNNISVALPVALHPNMNIFLSGHDVLVTTAFGVSVRFDGNHRVVVNIPREYASKVCGICGNFNGNQTDDFLNPDGELEPDSNSLGNSWQVDNDTSCTPGSEQEPSCTVDEKNSISNNRFCGIITDKEGPFKDCHGIVNPLIYFNNCVYDLCELNLDPNALCDSLQSYAQSCQSHDVTIGPWRNNSFCPLKCPLNSHYESCGTACPSTCVSPESPENCHLPCTESCVCDPGYVLYDKRCVPSHQCGCWDNDKHYPVGSEFWTDDTCSKKCSCPSAGSSLICNSASCPPKKYCGITNGVPGCFDLTFGNCLTWGDPHYVTFDKEVHDFMGICTYTLSKLCTNATSLQYFNIEAKNEHRYGISTVSLIQKVMVDVYDHTITIVKNNPSRVMVDGIWTNLPVILVNGSLTVKQSGRYVIVETDFHLTVSYDTDHTVDVNVPTNYFNQTCGMCGNFNGMQQDDYLMPNGQLAQNTNQLGDSWKVEDDDPLCNTIVPTPPLPCPPETEELYSNNQFCGLLIMKDGPFKACHSVINPHRFIDSCVFDLCALGAGSLCNALEAYADACLRVGVTLAWRNSTFCPIPCPANSHYNPCASACPATCQDQSVQSDCNKPCTDACECDNGFVLSGHTCVSVSECGCFYDGKYYQKNEIFWNGDCDNHCTCQGNNHVSCTGQTCDPEEVCKVQNGIKACFPADIAICHIYGDPHYITFDGKSYHFQGACNYTVVETCGNTSVYFSITTRNEHRGSLTWTTINSVAVSFNDRIIILGKSKVVELNGLIVSLPLNPAPGILIHLSGSFVVVQTDFGLEVKYSGDHELFVKVNENFKGKLCGLCGTYNGNQQDDFLTPEGLLIPTSNDFGNSWHVPDDNWVCEEDIVDPLPCDPTEEINYEDKCKLILSTNGPFKDCHPHILPQIYFENCVYDLCVTGGNQDQFCNALEAYAATCEIVGIIVGDWRENTICKITTTTTATVPTVPGWAWGLWRTGT
ncbi:IgGFc-binding protein-like [Lithobates pipiens]